MPCVAANTKDFDLVITEDSVCNSERKSTKQKKYTVEKLSSTRNMVKSSTHYTDNLSQYHYKGGTVSTKSLHGRKTRSK